MRHFEKLLNVAMQDRFADAHLFDVHLPDFPVAALNTTNSPDEVSAAIKALERNKASDLYGMRLEVIIDAASVLVTPISIVFDTVFDTDSSATHSIGRLCPILESGDQHDLDNYHGITVNTVLFQLFATVLERRTSGWVEEHQLRAAGQAGFRRDHCTTDNIIIIMRTLIESCKAMKTSRQHGCIVCLLC